MTKTLNNSKLFFLVLLTFLFVDACKQNTNKSQTAYSNNQTKIPKKDINENDLQITKGAVLFDTLPASMTTHKIIPGDKYVFVYKRSGSTMIDENDWDAEYTETLIFQIDTATKEFDYCDKDLKNIDCRYYWICLAKEIKKEGRNVVKGCIKGKRIGDTVQILIDVNPEFKFGGILERDNEHKIYYKNNQAQI